MEFNEKEMGAIQLAAVDGEDQLQDLSLLQLTLVAGGVGEVIFG